MNQKIAKSLRKLAKDEYPFEPKTGSRQPSLVEQRQSYKDDIHAVSKDKKKAYTKLNRNQRTAFNAS